MKFSRQSSQRRGMTLLVVMVLLAVMCVFMICAAQSITSVKRELKLIEKKQLLRHAKTPAAAPGR